MCLITKTRLDSETETLIPTTGGGFDVAQPTAYNITFCDANGVRSDRPNGGLYVNETDVSSTLTNAGVGTNVVQPVAIQGTLIGRGENAGPQGSGADVSGAMFTLTKTDVHAVAFGVGEQPDVGHCLRSGASKADKHESTTYVAQPMVAMNIYGGNKRTDRPEGGFYVRMDEDTSKTLDAASGLNPTCSQGGTAVMQTMQVRRLTPVECERLQGFPDGYTNIPWRGKPESPDGPRYKALGNSMAVPVMRYIGERINKVEAL